MISDLQRTATRHPPAGLRPVMRQRWQHLLFAHWRTDPATLQDRLPPGLEIDTYDGHAWTGIVPFFMRKVRPVWAPSVPWISNFLELNVRTYVVHRATATPGVWFFSLDCDRWPAVALARSQFHLAYYHAAMTARSGGDGHISFSCRRRSGPDTAHYRYPLLGETPPAEAAPGSLEFFLLERYRLFAHDGKNDILYTGAVAHEPYRAANLTFEQIDTAPIRWDGLPDPARAPDHACVSPGVDVEIYPLTRLSPAAETAPEQVLQPSAG